MPAEAGIQVATRRQRVLPYRLDPGFRRGDRLQACCLASETQSNGNALSDRGNSASG